MEQCVALVDYDALAPDELSFRKGEIINVVAKGSASGFWEGYVVPRNSGHGQDPRAGQSGEGPQHPPSGRFANCFVSSNLRNWASNAFSDKAVCLYSYTPSSGGGGGDDDADGEGNGEREMAFSRGDVITVVRPSRSPGWWFGVNESSRQRRRAKLSQSQQQQQQQQQQRPQQQRLPVAHGARSGPTIKKGSDAPEGGLTEAELSRIDALCGSSERPLLFPCAFVSCDIVQAVFDFRGRHPHELSCSVGDVILVHRRWNDGWWEGSLRGRRGIFPSNYTAPNVCTTRPAFFCAKCKTIYDDTRTPNMALFLHEQRDSGGHPSTRGDSEARGAAISSGPANLWRECATCSRHISVTDSMLRALAAYDAGEMETLDLFAFVQTEEGADGAGHAAHQMNGSPAEEGNTHVADEVRDKGATRSPALLDAKDVADISSGRVKSFEKRDE